MARFQLVLAALAAVAGVAVSAPARAEEGMWTFDNLPIAQMRRDIGFAPDAAWQQRVMGAAARLESGCSSAVVSPQGLVQTNHHCIVDCLQNFSEPGNDVVRNGFYAATAAAERRCPGLAVQQVIAITDVTAAIRAATANTTGAAFGAARDAEAARLETACKGEDETKVCEIVTLYQGGQYALYSYRRFDDVRMVFAPEIDAAFFGGDPDNFNFPRFALDAAFIRLYRDGRPAETPVHLRWRSTPLAEGEPTFVVGNPGGTSRQFTTAQMAFQRDHFLPWRLATLSELRGRILAYAAQGDEQRRQMTDLLFGVENTFNSEVQARVAAAEADLQRRVRANGRLRRDTGPAWAAIEAATAAYRRFYLPHNYLETRFGAGAGPLADARTLVRAAAEQQKPEAERLPNFTASRIEITREELLAPRPAQREVDRLLVEFWASKMREYLTVDDPLVQKALGRESPEALAERLIRDTRLYDPAVRQALWDGGAAAIAASTDPAIVLARAIDADARALRTRYREEVEAPIAQAQEKIASARFALFGTSLYPDATFTLRLSYGRVAGWTEPSGRVVAPFTRFGGLYERATGQFPFALTPRWQAAQGRLDPTTIYNVSSTHDIIGGNSGSPLIDRDGNVVGAVFDGNIHSLGGDYIYDGRLNRTVSVASTAIEEALIDVYGADRVVAELRSR
jgi:hypothetical protein